MSRITAVKEFTFDSAHHLPLHEGKCYNLHGHTYKLQIGVSAEKLNKQGMVMDFADIKGVVSHIIEKMDHHCLNDIIPTMVMDGFPTTCPTAEKMVLWLAEKGLPRVIKRKGVQIEMVRLYETPTSYAEWRRQ